MATNNTTTKKQFAAVKSGPVEKARPQKDVNYKNSGGTYEGQLSGHSEKLAEPMNKGVVASISSLGRTYNDIGEMSGFITDGYTDKGNTPFGENAKFNFMPPGMDISNQEMAEIHEMPLRMLVSESYPGDGWMPAPRDIKE